MAISHLDLYQWTLGSSKESATTVENLDIESGIVESSWMQVRLQCKDDQNCMQSFGNLDDELSSSTVAQWLKVLEDKLGEIAIQLWSKKKWKKVGAF